MLVTTLRILGLLLMVFSFTMIPPLIIAEFSRDGTAYVFLIASSATFITGLLAWLPTQHSKRELRTRDGFLVVCLFWTTLCLFGALPFFISENPELSLVDSIFESVSGLTTTGATVLINIDDLPKSILYYRQQLQLLGGMGIIVLAIAILPMLGIGGMGMFKAETTGPVKDNKLTPRITETAKALWAIYVILTVSCITAYYLSGMEIFDAVSYAFSTVSTGGYAPHNESFGFYESNTIRYIAIVFMLLGSINFSLHFIAYKRAQTQHYFQDTELKTFMILIFLFTAITSVVLYHLHTLPTLVSTITESAFQVVSLFSTTGFTTHDFSRWPSFLPHLILFAGLIGGCAGSTSGGLKTIRLILMYKQGMREIKRLVHPHGRFILKLNNKPVPDKVMDAVWGFIGIFFILFGLITMAFLACGLDFNTAFTSTASGLANIGPALGDTATHFHDVNDAVKWIFTVSMLIGRLEVFTIIILFTPAFWRS